MDVNFEKIYKVAACCYRDTKLLNLNLHPRQSCHHGEEKEIKYTLKFVKCEPGV